MSVTSALPAKRSAASSRVTVTALLATAIGLFLGEQAYRTIEVELTGGILRLAGSSGVAVVPDRQTVYFGLGSPAPLGLQVTPECTSAFLILPLLLISAVMVALRPRITHRVLFSLAVAGLALIGVNQLRLLGLVGLVTWLGPDRGYYWGHTLLGSMVSVFGGAIALVLFVWLSTRPPHPDQAKPQDSAVADEQSR